MLLYAWRNSENLISIDTVLILAGICEIFSKVRIRTPNTTRIHLLLCLDLECLCIAQFSDPPIGTISDVTANEQPSLMSCDQGHEHLSQSEAFFFPALPNVPKARKME